MDELHVELRISRNDIGLGEHGIEPLIRDAIAVENDRVATLQVERVLGEGSREGDNRNDEGSTESHRLTESYLIARIRASGGSQACRRIVSQSNRNCSPT